MFRIFNCIVLLTALTSCGNEDASQDSPSPQQTPAPNVNRNKVAYTGLEFPFVPDDDSREVIVHQTGGKTNFALEWDYDRRAQRWTCYTMTPANYASNGNSRKKLWPNGDPWKYDPNVDAENQQATYNELSKSYFPDGSTNYYEKGHICPSADRLASKEENEQTYVMTNILPMVHNFNAGVWEAMETQLRKWLGDTDSRAWNGFCDTLFVCKGGTISEDKILGYTIDQAKVSGEDNPHAGHHPVPRYFFMALLAKKGNTYHALGFWAEHTNQPYSAKTDKLGNYVVNIRYIEQQTGLDLFCNLPDDIEQQTENATAREIRDFWGL